LKTENVAAIAATQVTPEFPWLPLEWVFESDPLEIDVGCHRGAFVVGMAERYPRIRFLGIERQRNRVERTQKKLVRLGLTNGQVRQDEGLNGALRVLGPQSADIIHVSFPDPWPKRRHHVRRMVNAEFLNIAWQLLKPCGQLRLMTDDEPYFRAMESVASQAADRFRPVAWDDGREVPMTEFQRKFAAVGLTPHRLALAACSDKSSS
jgi:tRNA (guanine-N7-)-methyltransferase